MTTNEIEDQLKLRKLLNNFFQDVDTKSTIDNKTANAIVEVHLRKFNEFFQSVTTRSKNEGLELLIKNIKNLEIEIV